MAKIRVCTMEREVSEQGWIPVQVDIEFQAQVLYHCSSDHLIFPKRQPQSCMCRPSLIAGHGWHTLEQCSPCSIENKKISHGPITLCSILHFKLTMFLQILCSDDCDHQVGALPNQNQQSLVETHRLEEHC
jgi:hypothetical protein